MYVRFVEHENAGRKTKLYAVTSEDGKHRLGVVKWHSPWRRYCFFPNAEVLFDAACLREIAGAIDTCMRFHLEERKS